MTAADKHSHSATHIASHKAWKTFGFTKTLDAAFSQQHKIEIKLHNEKVSKNRDILRVLTNAVIFLGKQELAFRGHNEALNHEGNRGNYLELLDYTAKFDSVFERHLKEGTAGFRGTSKTIQNDLICAVDEIIGEEIESEINNSLFCSVQCDETTDVSVMGQTSIIVRYVRDYEVCERFLGFFDTSSDKSARALAELLIQTLTGFKDMERKLVIQTYDGASVMSGKLAGVQALVREKFPHANFIHCHAHRLNLVLRQTAQCFPKVKIFFSKINAFSSFASSSSKRKQLLREKIGVALPRAIDSRWTYYSRVMNVLCSIHEKAVEKISEFLDEDSPNWDQHTVSSICGLLSYLQDFEFCFLLEVFASIFDRSSVVFNLIQSLETDVTKIKEIIWNFLRFLEDMRCESCYHHVLEKALQFSNFPERGNFDYKTFYFKIIDLLSSSLKERFSSIDDFSFFDLFERSKFFDFSRRFPDLLLKKMLNQYDSFFNEVRLRSELSYIYSDFDFRLPPQEILLYIHRSNLKGIFPEVTKALQLMLTIPLTTASCERSFSTLKRIKTYLRSTMGEMRLRQLSRIAIERNVLTNCETNDLHERVVRFFLKGPRKLEFAYK